MSSIKTKLGVAEKIIREKNLVIKGVVYDIESLSIHHDSDNFYNKVKNTIGGSWYSQIKDNYSGNYIHYVDIDLSTDNEVFRLRINAIRDIETNRVYGPSGKAYFEIIRKIGPQRLSKYSNKKISEENTPLLYLKDKTKIDASSTTYQLPRYISNLSQDKMVEELPAILNPLMLTKSFDWMTDETNNQRVLISLYFLKKYGDSNYPVEFLLSKKLLAKYDKIFKESSTQSMKLIIQNYLSNNKHMAFLARALSVYFQKI